MNNMTCIRLGRAGLVLVLVLVAVLSGCAGKRAPDWQMNASSLADRAALAWLEGNTRIEDAEYRRALSEVSRSGQPALVLRLALVRCAARVASLEDVPCPSPDQIARDGTPHEQAYARYLSGQAQIADAALLPAAHRGMVDTGAGAADLARIENPQSRLIAAGVLFRQGRADPQVMAQAIDAASAQGWRRPLLAWLRVAQERARAAGATDEVQALQRRIDIVAPATQP